MGRDIGRKPAADSQAAANPSPRADGAARGRGAGPPPAPAAVPAKNSTEYLERLYKIIPAELTAAYLAIASLLTDKTDLLHNVPLLLAFAIFLTALTPFYLYRFQNVRTISQLIVSTISFPIWAMSISTAVVSLAIPVVTPLMITVVMVAWVLLTPLLVSGD